MASITVRNLAEADVAALKRLAKANNRSLEAEVRDILKRIASREETIARVKRIAAMTPDVPQSDSTLLIREERDRR